MLFLVLLELLFGHHDSSIVPHYVAVLDVRVYVLHSLFLYVSIYYFQSQTLTIIICLLYKAHLDN